MVQGHLDQVRSNLQSTKNRTSEEHDLLVHNNTQSPAIVATTNDNADSLRDFQPTSADPKGVKTHQLYADCVSVTGKIFTDQTGRFLQPSSNGNKDMLVLYDYDSNYIHVEAMVDRTGPSILKAYKKAHELLTSRGLKPSLQKLDNEASSALQQYMVSVDVDYQLVPPHVHRRNAAERAIRTFKNHFIAGLCSTDPDFPLHLWDRLLPQALLTLNLLRGSRINPNLSAYAQLHGAFDFNRTPIAPPGIKVMIHEKPPVRGTWQPHAVPGWYLGPAMLHYRCYRVWPAKPPPNAMSTPSRGSPATSSCPRAPRTTSP
jgi:hypothetical protein